MKKVSNDLSELEKVDIHSHILPGIDDGAESITAAVDVLRAAFESGTRHIIATPHFITGSYDNDADSIHEHCQRLQSIIEDEGIGITIHPGSEVFLSLEIVELYDKGVICTMNDSRHMLIELPMNCMPIYTDDILYRLQLKGVVPIIAHPERNSVIAKEPGILENMVNRGILAQVNSGSITGRYGIRTRAAAMKLIKKGLVSFVASDTHCKGRYESFISAVNIVKRKFGQEAAERLFSSNGKTLLENGTILH